MNPQKIRTVCPCRVREKRLLSYEQCCGLLHEGKRVAATPEMLMRSRYSAYVIGAAGDTTTQILQRYLLSTWHGSTAPQHLELTLTRWIGLDLLDSSVLADHGSVTFKAWYRLRGKAQAMFEQSRFLRVDGQWLYLDGRHDTD